MRQSRFAVVLFSLGFSVVLQASVTNRAIEIAEKFADEALRETYGLETVSLAVRTEPYGVGTEPERFWITISSPGPPCGRLDVEEVGEIYVQFVKNELYSVQWLPTRDPNIRAPETTRTRMLQWAHEAWGLDKQISQRNVPSTVPTQHLEFSLRGAKDTVTIVIDREFGFVHGVFRSAE